MELQKLVFVVADISGYTRFITQHRRALMHAEMIIARLLEAVMNKAGRPLVVHELLGDAVTFYAPAGDPEKIAPGIFEMMLEMYAAFEQEEAMQISGCSVCSCAACRTVGQLKVKFVVHIGEAVISTVGGMKKISGEDVILTHRWLKNTVPSNSYLLMTPEFVSFLDPAKSRSLVRHKEILEGLGKKIAYYQLFNSERKIQSIPLLIKGKRNALMNIYALRRIFFGLKHLPMRNITAGNTSGGGTLTTSYSLDN